MDEISWVLNSLASIATILGVVVTYLQYRVKQRPPVAPPGPALGNPGRPGLYGEPPRRPDRPGPVRLAGAWVIIDSAVSLLLLSWIFVQFTENLGTFGLNVDVSSEVEGILPLVAAAVIGVVTLSLAIRRSVDLSAGTASARGRLMGASAVRLFVGVFLVVVAQVLGGSFAGLPDGLASALLGYVGFGIVASLLRLGLLLHPDTRHWVGVRTSYPVGRTVGQH
jgi:hypothetical protein